MTSPLASLPLPRYQALWAQEECEGRSGTPGFHPDQSMAPGCESRGREVVFTQLETRCVLWPLSPAAAVGDVRELLGRELQLVFHHPRNWAEEQTRGSQDNSEKKAS